MKNLILLLLVLNINALTAQVQSNNFEINNNLDIVIGSSPMDSIWHIGPPQKTLFESSFSDPNALVTDTINNYQTNLTASFEVEIEDDDSFFPYIQIDWLQKMDAETGVDGGIIEASYDQGVTWLNVLDDTIYRPSMIGVYQKDTLCNGRVGLTGVSSDWDWVGLCWGSPQVGTHPSPVSTIKLRFTFISDSVDTNQEGWMLDNLSVPHGIIIGSTADGKKIKPLEIYPNPATTEIIINPEEISAGSFNLQILDSNGRKILDQTIDRVDMEKHVISIADYPTGVYFLFVESESGVYYQKLVKL